MYVQILAAGILSAFLTILFTYIINRLGKQGRIGNFYVMVRGGTPRAIGLAPLIALLIFLPFPFKNLVAIMGIMAFLDDLIGRKKIYSLPMEWGQIFRGLGMILVIILGYPYLGVAAILIALMIQPLNIADMEPGSACTSIIVMSTLSILIMWALGGPDSSNLYIPWLLLASCLGYAPLDYSGKIMLGEVGNHSFAVGLGLSFFLAGGLTGLIILFILTVLLIAFIRRKNLHSFLEKKLAIKNPTWGDYTMDILTGGGLGDLIRKIIFNDRQLTIRNSFLIKIGFRRLLYNPFARHKPSN